MIRRAGLALLSTRVQVLGRGTATSFVGSGYSSRRTADLAGSRGRGPRRTYASKQSPIKDHALGAALEVGSLQMTESLHIDDG